MDNNNMDNSLSAMTFFFTSVHGAERKMPTNFGDPRTFYLALPEGGQHFHLSSGWIGVKFCTDNVFQMMHPNDFGDPQLFF